MILLELQTFDIDLPRAHPPITMLSSPATTFLPAWSPMNVLLCPVSWQPALFPNAIALLWPVLVVLIFPVNELPIAIFPPNPLLQPAEKNAAEIWYAVTIPAANVWVSPAPTFAIEGFVIPIPTL